MSVLERCLSYRESNKRSKKRQRPTLGVRLIEVSVTRESTVYLISFWHQNHFPPKNNRNAPLNINRVFERKVFKKKKHYWAALLVLEKREMQMAKSGIKFGQECFSKPAATVIVCKHSMQEYLKIIFSVQKSLSPAKVMSPKAPLKLSAVHVYRFWAFKFIVCSKLQN